MYSRQKLCGKCKPEKKYSGTEWNTVEIASNFAANVKRINRNN